jgi:hypothetical protein
VSVIRSSRCQCAGQVGFEEDASSRWGGVTVVAGPALLAGLPSVRSPAGEELRQRGCEVFGGYSVPGAWQEASNYCGGVLLAALILWTRA